jgi:hypothetical protein
VTETYDRLIVITDEQVHDTVPAPLGKGYVLNVASYKHGVGYGKWTHVDGWSEAVVDYICELERSELSSPWLEKSSQAFTITEQISTFRCLIQYGGARVERDF